MYLHETTQVSLETFSSATVQEVSFTRDTLYIYIYISAISTSCLSQASKKKKKKRNLQIQNAARIVLAASSLLFTHFAKLSRRSSELTTTTTPVSGSTNPSHRGTILSRAEKKLRRRFASLWTSARIYITGTGPYQVHRAPMRPDRARPERAYA